ncbi:hypothetical protein OIE61_39200 [Streptomyces sp. NBC_01762]|uniref:hypothetical protein n=1 Tax=unclassified Streptomyces TaxID=2593676 RepID=UPI002DD7F803|nr:hypothetical protein [Streptomyces sp. NBC_01762]WSC49465.1 hypothetical protein OIE61_39200 [Streptomyces sp. NBC_01762]
MGNLLVTKGPKHRSQFFLPRESRRRIVDFLLYRRQSPLDTVRYLAPFGSGAPPVDQYTDHNCEHRGCVQKGVAPEALRVQVVANRGRADAGSCASNGRTELIVVEYSSRLYLHSSCHKITAPYGPD